jgi:hypothetical protein
MSKGKKGGGEECRIRHIGHIGRIGPIRALAFPITSIVPGATVIDGVPKAI